MRKKLLRGLLAGVLLLFIAVSFVYALPLDRSGTYRLTVLNTPDDTAPVYETAEMVITVHRFLFRPTLVRGSIRLGDRIYLDIRGKWSRAYDSYSFPENLERKADGVLNAWFVRENAMNTDYLDDFIMLESGDFETFTLDHMDGDKRVMYRAERME
jgi:hypothetical protein